MLTSDSGSLGGDGIHFTPAGYEKLGAAVAGEIRRHLKQPTPAANKAKCVVYGGTAGGVIAAVQTARLGKQVVLIEPGRHLGGMTSGGLGATDFKNPDAVGGMSREFYQRIKKRYADPTKSSTKITVKEATRARPNEVPPLELASK